MEPISSFFKIEKDPFYREGEAQGILKGKIETAKSMKNLGLSIDLIIKATKLSAEEVKKL